MSGITVDEIPSAALRASVVDELRLLDAHPPADEYADLPENPPPYNSFEVAYEHWCDADKAKLAMLALDQDSSTAATETELKAAKQVLKQLQATSKELFEKSRTKRNSFTSYFGFGKSNRKSGSPADASGSADSPVTEKFRKAHEAEMKQGIIVESLAANIEEVRRKREALNDIASGGNLAWNRLLRIVDGTLSGRAELAVAMGEAMERLDNVESAYNLVGCQSSFLQ
ncbi:hypothetical protein PILCRDRAFT_461047 [Piloderma croceum F 1598]|uniref:Uncharacterized protein n=1 Tax=Piloderma croceum (strain F 1598) TaxID=765440 RepID=A0A0C3B7V5_PILCF|nr:hypothetical protein PILCRDRAFT_461047 [Piloderma croceum F 1598]